MGKGKRKQTSAEIEKNLLAEKHSIIKKEQIKSRLTSVLIVGGIIAFGAIAVLSSVFYNNLSENGTFLRNKAVVSTKNLKANVCMTQYVFHTLVDQFATNYGETNEEMGFDSTADLKKQACAYEDYDTWYDYFADAAKNQLEEILILCEAAKEDGVTLTEGDEKFIETSMKALYDKAEEEEVTTEEYIDRKYGAIVSEKDIRKCVELTQLASRYQQKYASTLSYNDSEIESYFADNKASFLSADYIYFLIETGDTKGKTDAEITKMKADAYAKANEIAKNKSRTDFIDALEEYTAKLLKEATPDATKEEIKEQAETVISDYATVTDAPYDVSTKNGEWLFDAKRKAGDITVIEDEEGNGYYVFYLTTPAEKNMLPTKNVRHILLNKEQYDSDEDCEKAANKLLLEWRNGKKTEESFAALAELNTGDSGSVTNGGLYENVLEGQMVSEFNDWLFNPKRQYGDTDVIASDYGYHVMFYVGDGKTAWKADVVSELKTNDYAKRLEKLKKEHKSKVKENNLKLITQIYESTEEEETTEEQDNLL